MAFMMIAMFLLFCFDCTQGTIRQSLMVERVSYYLCHIAGLFTSTLLLLGTFVMFIYGGYLAKSFFLLLCSFLLLIGYFGYLIIKTCFKCIDDKQMTKNYLPLSLLLNEMDKNTPNIKELTRHEKNAKEKLHPMLEKLAKELNSSLVPLLTGSTAERFNVPLSDFDNDFYGYSRFNENGHALLSDHDFMIYEAFRSASFKSGKEYFIDSSNEDLIPGFVKVYSNVKASFVMAKDMKDKMYTSIMNTRYGKLRGYNNRPEPIIDFFLKGEFSDIRKTGTAINVKFHTLSRPVIRADITFSIQCEGEWPQTSDWPTRSREWPDETVVNRIVGMGFHLVPKSQPNDTEGITWRYSFSMAEVELSKLISPTARKCFIALKIIGKDFLKPCCSQFKSYFLKTIFLHVLEKTKPRHWCERKIDTCFHLLLDKLIETINNEKCPNFWIPEVDLYDSMTKQDFETLRKVVLSVKEQPKGYIKCLVKNETV